jgi:formate dehydrogenase major subunit
MHVIVEEKLYDRQYIQGSLEGFFKLKRPPAPFRPRTWRKSAASRRKLRTVARKYATANAASSSGAWASVQHVHGTDNARCLISLALMCGQTGRPAPACIRCVARTTCRVRPMRA